MWYYLYILTENYYFLEKFFIIYALKQKGFWNKIQNVQSVTDKKSISLVTNTIQIKKKIFKKLTKAHSIFKFKPITNKLLKIIIKLINWKIIATFQYFCPYSKEKNVY